MEIRETLDRYRIPWDPESIERLEVYRKFLREKNAVMDLTSVPDEETAERHFADSLMPLAYPGIIPGEGRAADVGSGAGFPGLPLALFCPRVSFCLIDAQEKRCAFLRECASQMGLRNVDVIHARAEDAGRREELREAFDLTVARAVAPLNVLCEYLAPLTKAGGKCVCWKGAPDQEEKRDGDHAARIVGFGAGEEVAFREAGAERTLYIYRKLSGTPEKYPRRSGIPSKRPLREG